MADTVSQMTKRELQELIELSVERKLLELLGDPDAGLEIKAAVRERLRRQQAAVAGGERGRPLDEVTSTLGLD